MWFPVRPGRSIADPIIKQDPGSPRWSVGSDGSSSSVEVLGEEWVGGGFFVLMR